MKNKHNFICFNIRKKYVIASLLIAIILSIIIILPQTISATSSPRLPYTVLIDAGHGGIDVGAVGVSGTKESDINLAYTLELKKQLERYGFNVLLTRKDENGLYEEYKNGFKMVDMNLRKQIIKTSGQDLFISIHQNKYSASSSYGPQVFYKPKDDNSKEFATCIQSSLMKNIQTKNRPIKEGDFYVLNNCDCPCVLIECGFLSNPEEEKLLINSSYRESFCYYIVCGIISFLA